MIMDELGRKMSADPRIELHRGAPEKEVRAAERELGLRFPDDYREFVRRWGWAMIGHNHLLGLGADTRKGCNVVRTTLLTRSDVSPIWPDDDVPIMGFGNGDEYYLDTEKMRDGVCPVFMWDHELDERPKKGRSFSAWLSKILRSKDLHLP